MKLIHIENKIDPSDIVRIIKDERTDTVIECLRIIRRQYSSYELFLENSPAREIALMFDIELNRIRLIS
jgi:hypothetical protein